MKHFDFISLLLVLINIFYVHTQILYECNFDDETILHHCFTTPISVVLSADSPGIPVLTAPASDVTSSCM
jgi:hypothetical protein